MVTQINAELLNKIKSITDLLNSKLLKKTKDKKDTVLIDIGLTAVTLLSLQRSSQNTPTITLFDRERYESAEEASRHNTLKKLLERNSGLNEKEIILTLSPGEIEIYNFLLPKVSEKELKEAIRWKITQLKPFKLPISQLEYTFFPWPQSADGNKQVSQQNTMLFCSPKKSIQEKTALLSQFGFKPYLLTPSLFGLFFWRLLKKIPLQEVGIWLSLGEKESFLLIEKQGIPLLTKSLSITSDYLTQQIANIVPCNTEEAEKLKLQYGLSLWSNQDEFPTLTENERKYTQISYGLASLLENLIIEIEHTFHKLSHQFQGITRFDRLYLSGEGTQIKNIHSFLHTKLGVPIEKIDATEYFTVSDSIKNKKDEIAASATHLVLTASTPQEIFQKYQYLDFLPQKELVSASFLPIFTKPLYIAIIMLGTLIIHTLLQAQAVRFYDRQVDVLEASIKTTQQMLTTLQREQLALTEKEGDLLKKKAYLIEKIKIFELSSLKDTHLSQIFADFALFFPDEVLITKLIFSNGKLSIIGTTEKTEPVLQAIEALRRKPEYRDVNFNYFEKDPKKQTYTFEAIAELR